MAFAKLQQEQGNNKLGSGGGMTGTATPGQSGGNKSQAGTPGGFTNIQDYMNANKGDTTNQSYLNNKADSQIGNQVNALNSQISSAPTINTAPAVDEQSFNNMLSTNDYTNLGKYATNPQSTPTSQELPDVFSGSNDPTSKIGKDLSGVMSYLGNIKEPSQSYTGGMQKFDEMLLSGDKEFPGQFAANKQADYKSKVLDPYGAATAARETQKQGASKNSQGWKNQIGGYLGGQDKQIQDILAQQQGEYTEAMNPQNINFNTGLLAPDYNTALTSYLGKYAGGENAGKPVYANSEDYNPLRTIMGMPEAVNPNKLFNPSLGNVAIEGGTNQSELDKLNAAKFKAMGGKA